MHRKIMALAAASIAASIGGTARAQCDSFTFTPTFESATSSPVSLAFGDLDGDGRVDMVVADATNETLSVLLGTGGGAFGPPTYLGAGRAPQAVALGDVDGDLDLDIVVCDYGISGPAGWQDHGFTVLSNSGGVFSTSHFVALPATEVQPTDVALGDLDGDHHLDVVLCLHGTGYLHSKVASFLGDGAGHFGAPALAATGYDPISLTLGDYDGDGALDAFTANFLGDSFSRLHGNGNGTFGVGYSQSTSRPQEVALGDFDGDGDLDMVVAYRLGVHIVRNIGGVMTWIASLPSGLSPVSVALVDLDGDGDLDLVSADQFGDALLVWRNDGTGAFTPKEQVAAGDGPVAIAVSDIDGDGDLDLGLALISGAGVTLLHNECPLGNYCVGKLNSLGCTPAIGATGSRSLSGADDLHVIATSELNNKNGIAFFGRHSASSPFYGGTLCVRQPIVRTPLQDSGGNNGASDCSGAYDYHVSHAWLALQGWGAGDQVFAQYWSRDPQHPDGTGIALSNALHFTLQP
jgi:hypothetical protein